MLKLISMALFSLSTLLPSFTSFADDDAASLLKKMDELFRSKSSAATMKMKIETPNWQRTLEMQSWTLGMDDTFIRVLSPRKDRGVTTLKIDNEMWNYFPKINKVIKVPPSMMMGSWMGSDFTNDDLVREVSLVDEYQVTKALDAENYRLTLTPKNKTVTVWGRIEIVVNQQSLLPVEQSYFNEKGEKVRTMLFSDIRDFNGKKMPAIMTMMPLNKTGHKTVIEYVDAEFDIELDSSIFTLRNLQKRF
ncbi:MAG: outer membrane lipoprotein-sorting protein [Colwellia sp.]